jgi:general stress protein 26
MEKQTLREWLKLLPLQKRLQAIENVRRDNDLNLYYYLDNIGSKYIVLSGSFVFEKTRQGHNYWETINNKYFI